MAARAGDVRDVVPRPHLARRSAGAREAAQVAARGSRGTARTVRASAICALKWTTTGWSRRPIPRASHPWVRSRRFGTSKPNPAASVPNGWLWYVRQCHGPSDTRCRRPDAGGRRRRGTGMATRQAWCTAVWSRASAMACGASSSSSHSAYSSRRRPVRSSQRSGRNCARCTESLSSRKRTVGGRKSRRGTSGRTTPAHRVSHASSSGRRPAA